MNLISAFIKRWCCNSMTSRFALRNCKNIGNLQLNALILNGKVRLDKLMSFFEPLKKHICRMRNSSWCIYIYRIKFYSSWGLLSLKFGAFPFFHSLQLWCLRFPLHEMKPFAVIITSYFCEEFFFHQQFFILPLRVTSIRQMHGSCWNGLLKNNRLVWLIER